MSSYNNITKKRKVDVERCEILTKSTAQELFKITELNLKGCSLKNLPPSIQNVPNLIKLDISDNPDLTSLPSELKFCNKLDILFASSCPGMTTLPPVLGEMTSIRRLGWRDGSLTVLDPNAIPPNLIHLILTNNRIESLSSSKLFEKLQNVRKLMLSHNRISAFGGSVAAADGSIGEDSDIKKLENLELLRLAGNKLSKMPIELLSLPKLTWLTVAGNPFLEKDQFRLTPIVPIVSMEALTPTGIHLGEGASGTVKLYKWAGREVAVKLIHGVTSDGRAEDELAVYGAVGDRGMDHSIVGCVALLEDDNSGKKGVLMERLPYDKDLALPPTIIEVTKDRWEKGKIYEARFVINVLRDVVKALRYLHNVIGVAHGDLYAHNIKVDPKSGHVFLLDFGASYVTGEFAAEAERLEVRAVGVLIGELLDQMDKKEDSLHKLLVTLKGKCVDDEVKNRPTFKQIEEKYLSKYK